MSEGKYGWGYDMVSPAGEIAVESFTAAGVPVCTNCGVGNSKAPFFRPINIVVEKGQYYATFYVDSLFNGSALAQKTAIWLQTLKPTDVVNLSIASLSCNIPPSFMVDILGAILASQAKIVIYLDQVVMDHLAYFYFTADQIVKRAAGAMFIPSYVANREEDMGTASRAVHDVFKRLVDYALERKILVEEEATKLHRGIHVILPADRFS